MMASELVKTLFFEANLEALRTIPPVKFCDYISCLKIQITILLFCKITFMSATILVIP